MVKYHAGTSQATVVPAVHFTYHQDAHIQCSSPVCTAVRCRDLASHCNPLLQAWRLRQYGSQIDSWHSLARLRLQWNGAGLYRTAPGLRFGCPPTSPLVWTCASHATAPSFSGYPGIRSWLVQLEATPDFWEDHRRYLQEIWQSYALFFSKHNSRPHAFLSCNSTKVFTHHSDICIAVTIYSSLSKVVVLELTHFTWISIFT